MKILLLSEFFPFEKKPILTGGVEARNYFLAKHLSKKNQVVVFCSKTSKNKSKISNCPSRGQAGKYQIQPLGFDGSYTQSGNIFQRLIFIISTVFHGLKTDFDIVDGSNFVTHLPALILGFIKRKPVFLWYADLWVGRWVKIVGFSGIIGEIVEKMVIFFGKKAHFLAISKFTRQNLMSAGIDEKKISIIPLGVSEEEIKKTRLRKNKEIDLVATNRFVKYKKTDEIVAAVKIVKEKYQKNIKVFLIGDGPEKEKLNKLIKTNKLGKNIKIVSNKNHEEVMGIVASSKIFVSASEVEGFGIAPVEAAAFGSPCLLKNIPPYNEHAVNLKGCLLFNNSNELAGLINNLLENSKKRISLGMKNKRNVDKFFWSKITEATIKNYSFFRKNIS